MKIYLLGLPGSGKTTLGRTMAESLAVPFVDLDAEIEQSEGMAIKEIFEKRKEDYFRKIESMHLKKWSTSSHNFVMATGGGAPCFFDNLETINRSGKSFFLDVPAQEIARRVSGAALSERPLLMKGNFESLKDHIEFMRSNRLSTYRQAHFIISGVSISVKELLDKVRTESQS